ncbi:hypothetical protein [Microtetraspora malaysiensis]|uniref:Guanylate cyclase domain-containing protein n=1 Tax=Microtetraspora malaysiensis TaxID=161358 RepID=A0ABW6SK46_9ACTN
MIPDMTGSHPLPPYRGLLAVDLVRYRDNRDRLLPELSALIPEVLDRAFSRCGLDYIWKDRRFPDLPGDGYVFGTPTEHLPYLIHPFLDALQNVLWELSPMLRARDRAWSMRMRVGINVGPAPDQGDPLRDRKGTATVETFRLLDSDELRDTMAGTEPDVTLVGAILSERVFQDVVTGGHTAIHDSEFRHVVAEVPKKEFARHAWIYVPRPSFRDGAPGPEHRTEKKAAGGPQEQDTTGTTAIYHDRVGQAFHGGTFNGGITFTES